MEVVFVKSMFVNFFHHWETSDNLSSFTLETQLYTLLVNNEFQCGLQTWKVPHFWARKKNKQKMVHRHN